MLTEREIDTLASVIVKELEYCVGGSVGPLTERVGSPIFGQVGHRPNSLYTPGAYGKRFCDLVDQHINSVKNQNYFRKVLKNNKDLIIKSLEFAKTSKFWRTYLWAHDTEQALLHYCYNWTKNEYWQSNLSIVYGYGQEKFLNAIKMFLKTIL